MSVDKEQRQALRFLDGLRTVAEMMQLESDEQSTSSNEQYCSMIRTYFEKADDPDKALLCSMKPFMMALVAQLQSPEVEGQTQSQSSIASSTSNESKEADAKCNESNIDVGKGCSNLSFKHEDEAEKLETTLNENHSSSSRKNVSGSAQWQEVPSGKVALETKLSSNEDEYSDITKKIQDISLDDADSQEQPVNYSLKYPEESSTPSNFSPHQGKRNFNVSPKLENNISQEEIYNAYAETDLDNLDQPIDYSQKYHEYIHDDCPPSIHFNRPSHPLKESCKLSCSSEDTIKVFCTEDTPLNFSSSSSLTDLRDVGLSGLQTPNSCFDESLEKSPGISHIRKEDTVFRNCSIDAESGFLTIVEENEEMSNENRTRHDSDIPASEEIIAKNEGEASVDETPLMFSRSSSLCSLNSFEQQSIHDDRSSVSDFSHAPSGIISPSDLPDSPLCSTPKVFKVEDTPVAFPFCDSLNPLQSRDQSVLSTNGKSTVNDVTLKYSPNCNSNDSNFEEHSVSQQHNSPSWHPSKSDLSHFSENVAIKKVMRTSNDAVSPESRDQHSFSMNTLSYPNSALNGDGYDLTNSSRTEQFKNYEKVQESTFQAQRQMMELSEKALIEQYISLGMPTKRSGKGTSVSLTQIGKSCNSSHSEQVHQQLLSEHIVGSTVIPENCINHKRTSPQIFWERQQSSNTKMAVSESVTPSKTDCQELLKTNVSKKCKITPSEKALLEEYILFGMPRNSNETLSPKLNQSTKQQTSTTQSSLSSPSCLKSSNHLQLNNMTSQSAARPLKIQAGGPAESSKSVASESSNSMTTKSSNSMTTKSSNSMTTKNSKTAAATTSVQILNPLIDMSGLSVADRAMLNKVISLGMPKQKS